MPGEMCLKHGTDTGFITEFFIYILLIKIGRRKLKKKRKKNEKVTLYKYYTPNYTPNYTT